MDAGIADGKVVFTGSDTPPVRAREMDGSRYIPVAVLLNASLAVTVTVNAAPAVCGEPAATSGSLAAAGFDVIELWVPVIDPLTVSVAVMDWT